MQNLKRAHACIVDVCEYLQYIELKFTGSLNQNDCVISHFCNKN